MLRTFSDSITKSGSEQRVSVQFPAVLGGTSLTMHGSVTQVFDSLVTELQALPLCACHSEPVLHHADLVRGYQGVPLMPRQVTPCQCCIENRINSHKDVHIQ